MRKPKTKAKKGQAVAVARRNITVGVQLSADEIYDFINTNDVFFEHPDGDVCGILGDFVCLHRSAIDKVIVDYIIDNWGKK